MNERPITVTRHAITTYRSRVLRGRSRPDLEEEIRQYVERGLKEGLSSRKRPAGFTLFRSTESALPPEHRFVRSSPDSRFGFIVKRTLDEGDIVLTTLTKAGVR